MQYRLQFDDDGRPRMYVFENCKAFRRTMPLMMYDENKVEDINTDLEDHVADEVRYMCMEYVVQPMQAPAKKVKMLDPLEDHSWD